MPFAIATLIVLFYSDWQVYTSFLFVIVFVISDLRELKILLQETKSASSDLTQNKTKRLLCNVGLCKFPAYSLLPRCCWKSSPAPLHGAHVHWGK